MLAEVIKGPIKDLAGRDERSTRSLRQHDADIGETRRIKVGLGRPLVLWLVPDLLTRNVGAEAYESL
jgi:hypothetical protein